MRPPPLFQNHRGFSSFFRQIDLHDLYITLGSGLDHLASRWKRSRRSVLKALAPALEAKGGSVHSFAEWTLAGHGIVLRLSTGQEFWLTLEAASC